MANYTALSPEQEKYILQQRSDVASNDYYSKHLSEWYNKYGKSETSWDNTFSKMGQATTATQATTPTAPVAPTDSVGNPYPTVNNFAQPTAPPTSQFTFDANQYLPQIQSMANSIYQPQQAQLEALKGIQQASYEQTAAKTQKDFDQQLKNEVEAINNRGSYFGGGAIQEEQYQRSQNQFTQDIASLQNQASQADLASKSASLTAEQTKYIQDELVNNQASAYNRFKDNRDYMLNLYQQQSSDYWKNIEFNYNEQQDKQDYQLKKDMFDYQILNDTRNYNFDVEKFKKEYNLSQKQFELAKAQFNADQSQLGTSNALELLRIQASSNNSSTKGLQAVTNSRGEVTGYFDPNTGQTTNY